MVDRRLVLTLAVLATQSLTAQLPAPLIIAHRGASGHRPEHTIEAYALAIEMGSGAIEPDLVATKDGILVARHENEIGDTTDVAEKFPQRQATRTIDGEAVTGWFTEDFTIAELRTLRARERLDVRSRAYDGAFQVPTFDDVLALALARSRETGRVVAVYPETKHPSYFRSIGLPLEERVVAALIRRGLTAPTAPVFIQSFDPDSLKRLRALTKVRLVQLTSSSADVTPERLVAMRAWADGIGVEKKLLVPEDRERRTLAPTSVVTDAHRAGLFVHVWTFRREPSFLPPEYGGDLTAEIRRFVALGIDGLFTDFPDIAVAALAR